MAEADVRRCIDWLEEKKTQIEGSGFGGNHHVVTDASQQMSMSRAQILEYRKQIEKLANKQTLTDAELHAMFGAYQTLETIADKKTGCLEMIKGVASIEDLIQGLSTEFDSRSVHLVHKLQNNKQNNGKVLDNETIVKATQSCMSAVRQTWRWLDEVMQCAHVHLSNASAYHQFFHDIEETDYFMNSTLSNIHTTFRRQNLGGDRRDINAITSEIQDTQMAYLRWQSKVDNLCARSRDIVPVHKRTCPCQQPQMVLALASYKTGELEFEEGETLTLLDNTDKARWKVKNGRDETGMVPALLLLINGPTGEALDAAVRLRLQLLGLWTTSVKRLGYQMIAFMQLVFRDWTDEEVRGFQQMSKADRADLLRVLKKVDTTLMTHWQGHEGFEQLQERTSRLAAILEEADNNPATAGKTSAAGGAVAGEVVVQVKLLENLLGGYQDFWAYWETYKVTTELSRQPRYILVCDKWDQLRFTSSAHYVRFWDTKLALPQDGGKKYTAEAALTIHETPADKRTSGGKNVNGMSASDSMQTTMTGSGGFGSGGSGGDGDVIQKEQSQQAFSMKKGGLGDDDEMNSSESTSGYSMKGKYGAGDGDEMNSSESTSGYNIKGKYGAGGAMSDDEILEEMNKNLIDKKDIQFPDDFIKSSESSQSYSMQSGALIEEGGDGYGGKMSGMTDVTHMRRQQQTTMNEVSTTMEEMESTFVIKRVVHPETQEDISLEEAIVAGIIDQAENMYVDTKLGKRYTLQEAMSNGDIAVEFKSQRTVKRERSSYGLVTIKTSKETRPYTIRSVLDPGSEKQLELEEAESKGIINVEKNTYTTEKGETMSILDAIYSGLIDADFHGKPEDDTDITKTYAVTFIVDIKRKTKVPFSDAMRRGLFDPEDGTFVNNVTKERLPFTEAVIKGHIKARVVPENASLDIDPSNRVVVERLASAQQKIMKQVRVAKAFQAARLHHMNGK